MPFPTPNQFDLPDRDLRRMFLVSLFELLMDVSQRGTDRRGEPLFEEVLLPYMRSAGEEMAGHFEVLIARASEISPQLEVEHGLGGAQLHFKLSAISFREEVFMRLGGAAPFRWLLDTLEGLLDSIIDAAGVGGAIKEFKEAVRNSTTNH